MSLPAYWELKGKDWRLYFCTGKVPKGFKTKKWHLRKDSKTGLAEYLGTVAWCGAWRQYIFQPANDTRWSSGCICFIANFLQVMNQKWRQSK